MKYILGCILLAFSMTGYAASKEAMQLFDKGITAFKQKDYKDALRYFQSASDKKLDSAALHYNLGVTYFRLANYDMAEKHFIRTSKFKNMAPIAYYNLGLVKQQQKKDAEARGWFEKARNTTTNPNIKALATSQLELRTKPKEKKWYGFAFANFGYNDNVTLDNDVITIASNQADTLLEVFAFTNGLVSGTHRNGVLLKASVYGELYSTLSNYNLTEINGGIYKTYPIASWNTESGLYLKYSTQGGRGYLQSANLFFSGKINLSKATRLRFRLRLRSIDAIDPVYASLTGNSQDIRIESRWKFGGKKRLRAYYQFDNNDRQDYRSATSFISRSPTRNRIRIDYYFPFSTKWNGQLSAGYRFSQYNDNNTDTATGLNQQRVDDRLRAKIAITRDMGKQLKLNFEYAYTQNTSTIATYDYNQNIIIGGVQYSF